MTQPPRPPVQSSAIEHSDHSFRHRACNYFSYFCLDFSLSPPIFINIHFSFANDDIFLYMYPSVCPNLPSCLYDRDFENEENWKSNVVNSMRATNGTKSMLYVSASSLMCPRSRLNPIVVWLCTHKSVINQCYAINDQCKPDFYPRHYFNVHLPNCTWLGRLARVGCNANSMNGWNFIGTTAGISSSNNTNSND